MPHVLYNKSITNKSSGMSAARPPHRLRSSPLSHRRTAQGDAVTLVAAATTAALMDEPGRRRDARARCRRVAGAPGGTPLPTPSPQRTSQGDAAATPARVVASRLRRQTPPVIYEYLFISAPLVLGDVPQQLSARGADSRGHPVAALPPRRSSVETYQRGRPRGAQIAAAIQRRRPRRRPRSPFPAARPRRHPPTAVCEGR